MGRIGAVLWLAALLLMAMPGRAVAHAELISTTPAAGLRLDAAPVEIRLRFSEPVELPPAAVRVLDSNAVRLRIPAARHADGRSDEVVVRLPTIDDGAYIVAWRAVSADAHPIRGAFTFRVGEGADESAAASVAARVLAAQRSPVTTAFVATAARAAGLAGLVTMIGAAAGLVMIAGRRHSGRSSVLTSEGPSAPGTRPPLPIRAFVIASMLVVIVAGVASLLVYGPSVNDLGLGAIPDGTLLGETLRGRYGRLLVARVIALLALGWLLLEIVRNCAALPRRLAVAGLFGTIACLSLAMSGHARTGRLVMASVAATALHVLAASLWLGTIAFVVVVAVKAYRSNQGVEAGEQVGEQVRRADGVESRVDVDVLRRLSGMAGYCVAIVVATGAFQTWRQVGSATAFTDTSFGRVLMIKLAFVAGLLLIGLLNRRALREREPRTNAVLGRMGFEVVLGLAVVVATSVLVNHPPARSVVAQPVSITMQPELPSALVIDTTLDPARAGTNQIHLYTRAPTGESKAVRSLDVVLSLPEQGIEGIAASVIRITDDHYTVRRIDLPVRGTWVIEATARLDAFQSITTSGELRVR